MIRALQRESADKTFETLALSPNVSLIWVKRSTLPGPKTKLAPSWNGFSPNLCWRWPAALARLRAMALVATQQVKQVRALQFGSAIRGAFHINEERERDASLFTEYARIVKIAHTNCRDIGSACLDFTLMLAQLRDVLAAEHSTVVTQEDDDGRLRLPQRAEPNGTFVGIGENNFGQLCAEACNGHLVGGLSRRSSLPHDMVGRTARAGGTTSPVDLFREPRPTNTAGRCA